MTSVAIILLILNSHYDYSDYKEGVKLIHFLLGPSTVVLAVPLYQEILYVRKYFRAIVIGISVGAFSSIISVVVLSQFIGYELILQNSLMPKSVTTPVGIELSELLNGLPSVTVAAIIITGITGMLISETIFNVLKITNPVAKGIAIGTSSHAIGTAKALEMGRIEGAMSSLSIAVCALVTSVMCSVISLF